MPDYVQITARRGVGARAAGPPRAPPAAARAVIAGAGAVRPAYNEQAELVVPMRRAVLPLDDARDIYARTEQNVP